MLIVPTRGSRRMVRDLRTGGNGMKDLWVSDEGTYGTNGLVLIDTENWTDEDWAELEESRDWDRFQTAIDISEKRKADYDYA